MDPDETLRTLLEALKELRWNDVDTCATDLLRWLRAGGFPPQTLGDKALGNEWHRTVTEFVCYKVLSYDRRARSMTGGAQ